MNILVVGVGYVGLTIGACLSLKGNNVFCIDNDEQKINLLNKGDIPIFEEGLAEIINIGINKKNLSFSSDLISAIKKSDIIFITVGTPTLKNGNVDLKYILKALKDIAYNIDEYKVIVIKSTVPVGTGERARKLINRILKERNMNVDFDIVSNPEFLRQGCAVNDFLHPDRIIIGTESNKARKIIKKLYKDKFKLNIPIIFTNIQTAEMVKYVSNSFLAMKVSFINEIANLCDLSNINIGDISTAIGLDRRIGNSFLEAGPGYGGSCFPKDTKAFVNYGKLVGYVPKLIEKTIEINEIHKQRMFTKIERVLGDLDGKKIAILGVAFKASTDDVRESPAIAIVNSLISKGAKVRIHDPKAMSNFSKVIIRRSVEYFEDIYDACKLVDCIVLVTNWPDYKDIKFRELKKIVNQANFVDLRNMFIKDKIEKYGFNYTCLGTSHSN